MIHSSRRDRKTKAFAEALAMIADAHTDLDPRQPRPVREIVEQSGRVPPNFALRWTTMQGALRKPGAPRSAEVTQN